MLIENIKIKNCNLKNRIVMPPMATYKANNGLMTPEIIKHYVDRADYVGMITVEASYILYKGEGCNRPKMIGMIKDNLENFKELTSKVHAKNCRIIIQIVHGCINPSTGNPVGPSNINIYGGKLEVEPLSKEDIKEINQSYAEAALLAKEGGFDGVEIHAAHGSLNNQFYSPITNKRNDEYGGGVENRIRFTCETIKEIRKKTGDDFIISVRLGGVDYDMEGNKIEDAVQAAKLLENCGADMISVSGGLNHYTRKDLSDEGYFRDASSAIKNEVHIHILLTGGIKTKEGAQKLIDSKACDLVGIGRPLLKNANYAKDF